MGTCVGAVDSNRIFDRILTPARHVVLTYFHTYMPGSIRGLFCAGQETNPALRHNRASPTWLLQRGELRRWLATVRRCLRRAPLPPTRETGCCGRSKGH
jgi:hypothetical protein